MSILSQFDQRNIERRIRTSATRQTLLTSVEDRDGGTCKTIKLSPTQVHAIYTALYLKQQGQVELARHYKVSQSTISDIWRHDSWAWLVAPLRHELDRVHGTRKSK